MLFGAPQIFCNKDNLSPHLTTIVSFLSPISEAAEYPEGLFGFPELPVLPSAAAGGVIGLPSWLRVLSATSIEGCSGEVTLHLVACHLSFHLPSLLGVGHQQFVSKKPIVRQKMCYH